MSEILSAESIIVNLASKIKLTWVAGTEDPSRPLHEVDVKEHATLIGHLNLIHSNIIQVIGKTECDYLGSLDDDFRAKTLTQLFTNKTVAIILSDDLPVPDLLCEYAEKYNVPVLSCAEQDYCSQDLDAISFTADATVTHPGTGQVWPLHWAYNSPGPRIVHVAIGIVQNCPNPTSGVIDPAPFGVVILEDGSRQLV